MDVNVNIEAGIENCGGMEDFYVEILDAFVEEGKREELIQNFADKDWELYAINVHSIKGSMRLIGADEAGEVAEKLQFAAEKGDAAAIEADHQLLIDMMDASLAKIRLLL